jgi:hypothetical protein
MSQYEKSAGAAVASLLGPRGRLTAFAREMSCPVGTVFSWKQARSIPAWRRPAVLDAVRRMKIEVPVEVIAYLADAA